MKSRKNSSDNSATNYRGRFAPSTTGPLHFGSLVSAMVSYLDARAAKGEWIVRIEDLDVPRLIKGADTWILNTLEAYGFEWHGPVVYQSQRIQHYSNALAQLSQQDLFYYCQCSRKQIARHARPGAFGYIYPGNCRNKQIDSPVKAASTRLKTDDLNICFTDRFYGNQQQNLLAETGDFIIRRADGLIAYQLAVVVDDADQGITHIVRGSDLIESTARQIYLQQCLHYPTPDYMHHPVVADRQMEKLSKQTGASALPTTGQCQILYRALTFLGQKPPDELKSVTVDAFWHWAIEHWNVNTMPTKMLVPQ